MTERSRRHRGMVLVAVAASLGLLTAGTLLLRRRVAAIVATIRHETSLDTGSPSSLVALGAALAALQTNTPPNAPYQCALSVAGGTTFDASYSLSGAVWTVQVSQPSVATDPCPPTF